MYEYAATAMGPKRSGASFDVTNIAVGPSAPPMIPVEAASKGLNPKAVQPKNAIKIPSCAAAPKRRLFGFAISGPKSVIAPTPRKIRQG